MTATIFYSWQSDSPRKINHDFIRAILDDICHILAEDTAIDEPLRELSVDSDTQGVAGQPPIVETIFKKIDSAEIFVADVTFTGKRPDERPTPNPNVLIEYGWALKSRTHERVICVMNTYFGEPSGTTLPFDMAHLRWPICYSLDPKASKEYRQTEAARVKKALTSAIRTSLGTVTATSTAAIPFPPHATGENVARFRAAGQSVGIDSDGGHSAGEVFLAQGSEAWLRVMPAVDPAKHWTTRELKANQGKSFPLMPLFGKGTGWGFLRSEDGFGVYSGSRSSDGSSIPAGAVTMAFESGEIWTVETRWLSGAIPFVEPAFAQALTSYADYLGRLGCKAPFIWIAGIRGMKGMSYSYPLPPNSHFIGSGPVCVADEVVMDGRFDPAQQSAPSALLPFFERIFAKCDLSRPEHLPKT